MIARIGKTPRVPCASVPHVGLDQVVGASVPQYGEDHLSPWTTLMKPTRRAKHGAQAHPAAA